MSEPRAEVSARKRLPAIWLVPIVALAIGLWMVIHTLRSEGPEITITFSTAEGIEAGKTKVKLRAVEVGLVETAGLGDDLESVRVTAKLERAATPLLREDTQFWVVRPRFGRGGISGLGTLLSGGYIQIAPGTGKPGRREFVGLEAPPVTPPGTPGLYLSLVSRDGKALSAGDPITYEGSIVGRIESADFDVASRERHYGAFIEKPYDGLVTSATRFWDASGFSVSITADGIEAQSASLESLLLGGVAFGLPEGASAGAPVENGAKFDLYPSYQAVNERPFRESIEYVVQFSRSVRGLKPGAPVDYRGIRIGHVERLLVKEAVSQGLSGKGSPIPVLIRVEPGRVELPDTPEGSATLSEAVVKAVDNGLRATLETGSLLTGQLMVSFDVFPDAPSAQMGSFAGFPTIPTTASGLAGIERRVATLLDKLNELPIEAMIARVNGVLDDLNQILASDGVQALPASLDATLTQTRATLSSVSAESPMQEDLLGTIAELDRTLQSLRAVLDMMEEKPNALIFNRDPGKDPRPPAGPR